MLAKLLSAVERVEIKLDRVLLRLGIIHKDQIMSAKDIEASVARAVAAVHTVEVKDDAILTYVKSVPELIKEAVASANGDDSAAIANINALADSLASSPDAILAAINANTTPVAAPPQPEAAPPPADAGEPPAEAPPAAT